MLIRHLTVDGFRNLTKQEIPLCDELNVLAGENGQGKTNLLEAVFLLASLRSFRTSRLGECIGWGRDAARVVGRVERRDRRPTIEVSLVGGSRRVRIDGKALRSARDYGGDLNAVVFTPEDLTIARGSPAARRRFLDRAVYSSAPAHLGDLLDYEKALRSRNALIRDKRATGPAFDAHTAILTQIGARVIARRLAWIENVRGLFSSTFEEIAAAPLGGNIVYQATAEAIREGLDVAEIERELSDALSGCHERDLQRGFTTIGPHTDDLSLLLREHPLRIAGSQGQQRAFVLALKLSEIRLAEVRLGEPPVLLLDDVGGELDDRRRTKLFSHLEGVRGQVIVTTTSASLVPLRGSRLTYRVTAGAISPSE